eukprot:1365730-Prorocentrum_lima.AAC.1
MAPGPAGGGAPSSSTDMTALAQSQSLAQDVSALRQELTNLRLRVDSLEAELRHTQSGWEQWHHWGDNSWPRPDQQQ